MRAATCLLSVALLAGCGEAARRAGASVEEYTLYRNHRLAASLESRLSTGYAYLRRNPQGVWTEQVRRSFANTERAYLAFAWEDIARLKRFLRAVPSGDGAERATRRIEELKRWYEYEKRREQRFNERIAGIESRLAAAAQGRRELLVGVADWARRFARELSDDVPSEGKGLLETLKATDPPPRCSQTECTKTFVVSYEVPEQKRPSARQAVYDVTLRLDGNVTGEVELKGPSLFSRIGEAVALRPVSEGDYAARAEAIARAVVLVATAIDPVLPEETCAAERISPVIVHRICQGVEFVMIAATSNAEEDRIRVTRSKSPSASRAR